MASPVALTGAGNVTTWTSTSAASTGTNLTKPGNTADGDLLVAALYFRNASGTITPPSGWTQLGNVHTTGETFTFYAKPIPSAAAETATSYNFSTSAGSGRLLAAVIRVTGANLSAFEDARGATSGITGTASVVMAAVSTTQPDTLLLSIEINNTTVGTVSAITADAAMSEVVEININTGTATSSMEVDQQAISGTGSTGTRTATFSPAAANSAGMMVAIAPAILVPVNGVATGVSTSQMDLTWDAFPGATGYDVERDGTVIATNVATNAYSDTGLGSGTSHDYRVRAVL